MNKTTQKVSFFSKTKTTCPACRYKFNIETYFTGRGRLNSVEIANDLRRIYQPSKKFGTIYPLIYHVLVCPKCWFAALPEDFHFDKKSPYDLKELNAFSETRKKQSREIIPEVDFKRDRNLHNGLISYFLAISSYQHFYQNSLKTVKKAILALRASWVIDDLLKEEKEDLEKYQYLKEYFRFLSFKNFSNYFTQMYDSKKKQFIEINYYGPDIDFDYGYKGFVYTFSYLSYEFIEMIKEESDKLKKLNEIKIMLAKIFGFGRSSKGNPSPLLEKSRIFYDLLKEKIAVLENNSNFPLPPIV